MDPPSYQCRNILVWSQNWGCVYCRESLYGNWTLGVWLSCCGCTYREILPLQYVHNNLSEALGISKSSGRRRHLWFRGHRVYHWWFLVDKCTGFDLGSQSLEMGCLKYFEEISCLLLIDSGIFCKPSVARKTLETVFGKD